MCVSFWLALGGGRRNDDSREMDLEAGTGWPGVDLQTPCELAYQSCDELQPECRRV